MYIVAGEEALIMTSPLERVGANRVDNIGTHRDNRRTNRHRTTRGHTSDGF